MGNVCCGSGNGVRTSIRNSSNSTPSGNVNDRVIDWDDKEQLEGLLRIMKEYHLERLRRGLRNDLHTFILDNLLMCIQFFDNFEKSVDTAKKFKREYERDMTKLLMQDPLEGTILGERHINLLTGMSDVLAQNYIFKGKNASDEDEATDIYYNGVGYKDTFMSEGILPLEFTMTWDNLEIFDSSQYNSLKSDEYSHAKGSIPESRFCREQPDKKMDFPPGFVRLRCVDEPNIFKKQIDVVPDLIHSNANLEDELVYSRPYSLEGSESDVPPANSGTTSDDEDAIGKLKKDLENAKGFSFSSKNKLGNDQELASTSKSILNDLPKSRPTLQKLQLHQSKQITNEEHPRVVIHEPTPPVREASLENHGFVFPLERMLNRQERPPSRLNIPSRDSPGKETSSGYETTSTMSRASSEMSSVKRNKWQKLHVKRLLEFTKKSRKNEIAVGGSYDPIPFNCYHEIKYSYDDYDHEENHNENGHEENDEEFYPSDSEIMSNDGMRPKSTTDRLEDEEETRFYLNSLQFSSSVCSEFHFIGPKLSIPPHSLENGVVLDSTIRCPIPYSFPKDTEEEAVATIGNYFVTYTFTPVIRSKWPTDLYNKFKIQNLAYSNDSVGDAWPSLSQLDEIENQGCHALPLGYRSIEFFNKEQILEWELSFEDSEALLLNSFKHPHWRVYIFAAVLFRAFIAPLGPQGIGLKHVRNVLYFMCNENYSLWNDEEPGFHFKVLLKRLISHLSKRNMPSFFVRSRNLIQNIPEYNLRYVHGHLNQIRENPIIYCIYSFRNILSVRKGSETQPFLNLKHLYEILTFDDSSIVKMRIEKGLWVQEDQEEQQKRESERLIARRRQKKTPNLIEDEEFIDKKYFGGRRRSSVGQLGTVIKEDGFRERQRRRYEMYTKRKQKEEEMLKEKPDLRLPKAEKRESIDLKKTPVIPASFSSLRILLMIQFFIEQFLKMAERATEIQCYDQATMYVLQIENLCELVKEENERYSNGISPISNEDLQKFRRATLRLRGIMGKAMQQYILARNGISSYKPSSVPTTPIDGLPSFTSNWDLRKLPTPPPSQAPSVKDMQPSGMKFSKPMMASTFKSFENVTPVDNPCIPSRPTSRLSSVEEVLTDDNIRKAARRQESIKFVSPVLSRATSTASVAGSNLPKLPTTESRPISRESTFSIKFNREDDGVDSTDL